MIEWFVSGKVHKKPLTMSVPSEGSLGAKDEMRETAFFFFFFKF